MSPTADPGRPRYEAYKDALRRGHVAALRGHAETAIAAYREAAGLAPERALPQVGLASALRSAGRPAEALAAYGQALARAPRDEGALGGRAALLAELGRRSDAADDLSLLAEVLEAAGRLADAADATRRALELVESRTRRRAVERLAGRLREGGADAAAIAALEASLRVLEPMAGFGAEPDSAGEPGDEPASTATSAAEPPASRRANARRSPGELVHAVVEAETASDPERARPGILELAAELRSSGLRDAAMDACLRLLATAPADPELHLLIAELQLDHGWRVAAAEKLRLLRRLADLTADDGLLERVSDLEIRLAERA